MTTGREDTRPRRAVVVGADRPGAAQVFGGAFDRMLTTTYDELAADLADERAAMEEAGLAPDPIGFVGVAAGPGMQVAVEAGLALVASAAAAGEDPLELAVEVPWDLDAIEHLRERLTAPGAPVVSDVRRYRDRPCLVIGGPAAPVHDHGWLVTALLTAGTTAPDARVAEQERVAAAWERASAQAQLERAEAEVDRLRKQLKRRSAGRPAGAAAAAPAPEEPGSRAVLTAGVAALGRGAGARTGALLLVVAGLLALVVPTVGLGLLAGDTGVAVGLALGVLLVAVAGLAVVVLGVHRVTAGQLLAVQSDVARHARATDAAAAPRDGGTDQRLGDRLADLERGCADLSAAVADEGRTTRRQVQALVNLNTMVPLRAGLPPLGSWAVSPDFAVEVVDRLLTERPRLVVEAGSGASTLLLALAAREHGLDTRIVSLDHDAHFAAETRALLERHGVADRAEVRWAPLARTHVPDHLTPWYDEAALADLHDVGLLVVDGPPAATGPAARYPAVPLLQERLAPRCTIVVDDTGRDDDREVVDRWARLLPDFDRAELPLEKGASVLRRG